MADHKMQIPDSPILHSSRIMENFKTSVFRVANSDPNTPLSPTQIAFIEQQLLLAFPVFKNPIHPTYTAMIETAVKELNEEDGSNEEAISKYIKENYEGLPWAHSAYLSHHLKKMYKNDVLICTSSKLYTTPTSEERNLRSEQPNRRLGRKTKECGVEEGNSDGEKVAEVSGDVIGFQEEDIMVFRRSRVKRRRRSFVVVEEDDEGGGFGGEQNVINSSQNSMVVKCSEAGAIEDEDNVTWRSRVKRKRRSCVVVEEDGEVEGAAVVGGEQNIIISSENLVVGKNNEEVVLEDVVDLTGETSEMSEELGGIGTVGEDHNLVNVPVEQLAVGGLKRELPSTECQYELKSQVLPLDYDECEEKTKPKLLVPSSAGTLLTKCEGGVTTEMVTMHDDDSAAELVLVPVEKSSINIAAASNIRVDVDEVAVKKSALKESEFMIVPFERNTPISAVSAGINPISVRADPTIICGLAIPEPEQRKRKQQVYSTKKKLKARQEKMKVSSKSVTSMSALAVGCNLLDRGQLHELSSQTGVETKLYEILLESPMIKKLPAGQQACTSSLREDGYIEQQERQKFLNPPHLHSSLEELISVEDEENLPLQQVFEKCGKRKKHATEVLRANTPLVTEASSISGSKLHGSLPNSVQSVRIMRKSVPDTLAKKKEKQPPLQRRQRKLKPQDQKHSSFEVDAAAATGSKTSPSLHMEKRRSRQRCVGREPQIAVVDSAEENVDMVHQHQHLGQGQDQGSFLRFEQTAETFPSNDEGCSWKDNQQTRSGHDFPCEPEQSTEVTTVKLSRTQHLNGQKDELDIVEMVTTAVMEEKVPTLDQNSQQLINQQKEAKEDTTTTPFLLQHQCLWQQEEPSESASNLIVEGPSESATNLNVKETSSKLCQIDKISSHELVTARRIVRPEVKPSGFVVTEHVASDILQSEQEKHQKQSITKLALSEPSLQNPKHEKENQEGKSQIDVRLQDLEATMATLAEEIVPTVYQKCEQKIKLVERKLRQRPQKQLEISKEDAVPSSNDHLQQQEGLSIPATQRNLKQQIKQKKARGRPPKKRRATKVKAESLNLQPQLRGLSEPATGQHSQQQRKQLKKRGRPRKQKEETRGSAVTLSNLHLQQQGGLSEPEINQNSQLQTKQPKKDGTERPLKQIEAAKEDKPVSLNLHFQLQEESSELAFIPDSLHKQTEAAKEDAAASLNLHLQQQVGLFEPATHQISQLHVCEKLQNEVHRTPETGQAIPPSYDDIDQQLKKQKLQVGDKRPKTRAMKTASDNQPDQQQNGRHSHEHEGNQGKFEGGQRPKTRAMTTSDNQLDQQQNEWHGHELEGNQGKIGGMRPKTRAVTTSSDTQPDQQKNERHCHEHEGNQGKLEGGQRPKTRAMTTSSDNQPDQQKNERLYREHERKQGNFEGGQRSKTRAMTTSSDNQLDQQQNEWHCHEHEGNQGKIEGQSRLSKEKSAKITVVPLASKDQLRSRIKRQPQDST